MKRKLAIAWLTVGGGILGAFYVWLAIQNPMFIVVTTGVVGLFVITVWCANVLTVSPAAKCCGDSTETDAARNIKNDADAGEAARKE